MLTFIPTPTPPDLGEINNDLAYMFRRMRLKLHFADMETESESSEFEKHLNIMFRNKSKWTPAANADVFLDAFIEAVKQDFYNLKYQCYKQNPNKNITAEEAIALTHLKNNENIIIKKADKGAAVVIMSRDDYIKEGIRQLSDANFYVKLDHDPTPNHIDEIHNTLLKALQRDEITKKIFEFLVPTGCTTPAWYFLPKIHKENITGRPIVSGNNSPTEKISAFVDEHIKMMVPLIPSYVRDTPDFIKRIENFSHRGDFYLVTMDVTSLYTNIPNMEGLVSIARSLIKHQPDFKLKYKTILELLKLVLHKNNFQFNGEHYLQIGRTAMGTKVAPSYANLFMARLEEKLLEKARTDLQIELPLYLRYIDDIFFIFPYSETKLQEFMTLMNSFHKTIKFTEEHSREEIIFLDTYVKRDGDSLYRDLYVKETATHSYLLYTSCHPQNCIEKGPFGQFLRIKRNCTKDADFEKHAEDMKKHYADRGYPDDVIQKAYEKARQRDHHDLIHGTPPPRGKNSRIPLVLTYNPLNPNLMKIIKKNWHILHKSPECKELFPDKPMLAFRRNRNLRDNLVRANLLKPIQTEKDRKLRRNKCVTPNCKWCQELKTSTSITCTTTGCTYRGPENINCRVNNVVYILTCKQCNKQYIGETGRPFIERWKEHLYDIKVKRPYPVARHFNENDDHKKATFHAKILSMINGTAERATQRRKYKENRWIQTFKSFQPEGINLRE